MDWLHERFASMAPPLLPMLLDAAIKGAALLLLTAIAAFATRRASAAARHLMWSLAVAALLFLPFFSVVLPGWHILPTWAQPTVATQPPAPPTAPRRDGAAGFPVAPSEAPPPPPDFGNPIPPSDTQLIPLYHPPTWHPAPIPTPPVPTTIPPQIARPSPQHAIAHPHNWQESVLLIWLIGSVLYCLYILLGCLSLWHLARQSSPITDPAWTTALRQARQSLRFTRPVYLITHPRRGMPMTWGLWRAWILLPAESSDWSADQRRAVLLHELAHAKRCDCLTQLITQLALALYWFNPLLWLAWKRIQTEREQACDDLVLSTGQKASAYAEQLLRLAAAPPPLPALSYPAAIAMARPSTLESRLRAILDTSRNRRAITRRALAGALIILAAIAVPLAMVRANDAKPAIAAGRDDAGPSDFAGRFVVALARQHLSFLDEQKLERLKARMADFEVKRLPRDLPQTRREALLKTIDTYVKSRFRNPSLSDPDDPTAQDGLYLGLGDAIQTFEWQLWLAANRQPLSAGEETQRQSQRQWIQQFIRSLPPEPGTTQASVLGEIDRLYADPLNPLFSTPMTAENFKKFRKLITADPVGHELVFASAHCMQKAWSARYPRIESLPTPFDHGVTGSWGIGGTQVELGFAENEARMGKSVGVADFHKSRDVIGLIPPAYRQCPASVDTDAKKMQWLADRGKDDLVYDAAAGGSLVGPSGAKILQLNAHCWIDADRIGDADLRHSLRRAGQPTFSLAAALARYRSPPSLSADCFIGVLTAGGKLAVVKVDYFDPGVGLIIRPRGIDDPLWLPIRPATQSAAPAAANVPPVWFTIQPFSPVKSLADEGGGPATRSSTRPATAPSRPIFRRVLSIAAGGGMQTLQDRAYLDLDDGDYVAARTLVPSEFEYVKYRKIDLSAQLKGQALQVVARHMELANAAASIENPADASLSLDSARRSLADAKRADETALSPGTVYFFRSLQDDIGVLRVSDISAGQPPTATVDYRILYSVPWGNAGKGVQVRLRPEESSWGGGQTPTFVLDLRNTGKSEFGCLGIPDLECKFNVDGTWYGYSKPIEIGAAVQQLAPGEKLVGIVPIQLTSAWAQPKTPGHGWPEPGNIDVWTHPLSLAPGPHSLAVAFDNEKPMEPGSETVKALSNTATFDVLPAGAPASQPATRPQTPRAGKIWFDIFPSLPVKSLADFGPAFVVLDPASTGDPHATGAVGLEICSADNSRRVADIPRVIELKQYLAISGIRLERDQLRRVGPIADGSYLAALTSTGGARCSEVFRLVIDSKYTPPAEPTLRLVPTPMGPGEKLPAVWVVGTGPKPIDNHFTNVSVMLPTLIVDGVKHDPVIPPMGMPVGPIRPGESYAAFVRLADFTPPIAPKAQYRVKAKTAGYESAEVTIPAVDSLGLAWDAATARLAPLPPAIPELRGTVIGPDGKPAAGAQIMLQGPAPSGSTAATERCDTNGQYAFVNVPPGHYMMWAEPFRIDSISIQPGKTLVQDFSRVERFKLTGEVSYQNGVPAAGKSVDVTATSNDGKVVFDASADTDARGRYSVGTPFNNIAGVILEGAADQGPFPEPAYHVKASAAPVNLVIPANAPGTTQPAEADRWGVLRPGLSYRLSTPHDPWPIGEKPIVWLDVKNTTSAAQHLLDGGAVALRLTGLPKDETVRLTYRTGNDVLIKPGDSVTFAITFPAKLLKPGRYPVRCAFVPNPKDAAPGKGGFRACPPLILATVAPAPPVPTSGPATQPALRDPWGRVGDFARYRLVPPAGATSTHDPVTAVLEIENIGRNPLPLAERNMGNFFADVAGWQWDETYDPTTWTAGDPKTGRDTGKPIGSVPAGGRELLFIHFNEKLPLAGKYELECGFAPAPQFEAPQSRAMPVGLFVVEPGQSAAPDVDPADHSRAAWGPAVDHMQARLYRRDPVHDGGDIDDLTIELRNIGDRQMAFDPSLGAMELEIDGKWYHAGSTSRHPARLLPFGPGIRWYDWASMYLSWSPGLYPTADWRDADGQSLRLAHGKHTVRLAITLPPMPGSGGSPVRLLTNAVERNTTRDFGSATPLPFMDANQPPNPPPAPATQPNPLPDATQPAANPALSSGPWHTRLPCGVTVELVGVSTNPSSDHSWWRPDGSPMAHPPAHAPSPTDVGTAIAPAYEFAIFVDNVPFAHETGDFQIIDKIEAHPDPFGHDGTSSVSGNWFPRPSPDLKVQPILHLILQSFAPTEDRTTIWLGISGGPWKAIGDNVTNGKAQAESRMGIKGTKIDISYAAPYEALWQANLPKNMPNREDMATFIDVAENLPADQQVRVAAILTSGKEVLSDKNPEVTDGHVHQVMARFRNVSISEIKLFRLESRPFQWTEFKDIPLRPNAAITQPSGRAFAPSAR